MNYFALLAQIHILGNAQDNIRKAIYIDFGSQVSVGRYKMQWVLVLDILRNRKFFFQFSQFIHQFFGISIIIKQSLGFDKLRCNF